MADPTPQATDSYDLEKTMFEEDFNMDPESSLATPGSGTSDRSKFAFFALQRAIERLRAFYSVLQVAFGCLIAGVILLVLTEILWRFAPFVKGYAAEAVISGFSALGWLLVSATVAITSTCPVDELDFNAFVTPRPVLCMFLAILPLITGATRVWEMPLPRWISCMVALLMLLSACLYSQHCSSSACRRFLVPFLPSFAVLMEVWNLDVIIGSAVNEVALEEGVFTDVWLALHGSLAVALQCWLWWKRYRSTIRFNFSSHMSLSWQSSYFFCRAIDLATGNKTWEAERHLDVAIGAAVAFAVAALLPLTIVWSIGRERLFKRLSDWVEHRRRLQEGAFMAMLLDSYVVEIDQPWWLSETEAASSKALASWIPKRKGTEKEKTHTLRNVSRSVTKSVSLPNENKKRPGFVKGKVVQVAEDGKSFFVELPDGKGMQVEEALNQLVVMPLSHPALMRLTTFDCSVSSCYDPNEELRLRHVIGAIGTERFEMKIRQLGQLILDRELSKSRGLLVDEILRREEEMEGGQGEDEGEDEGEDVTPPDPVPTIPHAPVASVLVRKIEGCESDMEEGQIIEI
eukprot:Skav207568  [mRNA]  locus=scaffold1109:16506:19622:+ [translate_table: standard]